ncbi:hypothetical protein M8542_18305 [Amycolatopsis sp. OK19-0408]|uniref:Uncharacterized protein n=1 Tax=Amycolatopsis iheyensis TaxID=2945988 RepID=A0A9X2N9W5_9PSEU|nr:hypothetical protein [Amycolatopsis iheyensis]MCR6484784.1 hypothetical protein [Amycolatopsis iheyensis]
MTAEPQHSRRRFVVGAIALVGVAALVVVAVVIALAVDRSSGPSRAEPDYEAVVRDTVSIIFPGSVASPEQVHELLPSSKRSTDVACDNLARMSRSEVVGYTTLSVGDRAKADMLVASMERNVCSRR